MQTGGKSFMTSSRVTVAAALAGATLVLALVDALAGGSLPLDVATGGIVFGLTTIAFSTTAFFISLKHKSILVSALLVASGIVITLHGVVDTRNLTIIYFPGPILGFLFGLWVITLGIVKSVRTGLAQTSVSVK